MKNLKARLRFQSFFIKFIADSAKRQDPLGPAVVLLDGFSEPPDVHVDGSRRDEGVSAPDPIEQLIAAQNPARILDEKPEKLKLLQCQLNRLVANEHIIG